MIKLNSGINYSKTLPCNISDSFLTVYLTKKELHLQKFLSDRNRGNGILCGMTGANKRNAGLKINEILFEFEVIY